MLSYDLMFADLIVMMSPTQSYDNSGKRTVSSYCGVAQAWRMSPANSGEEWLDSVGTDDSGETIFPETCRLSGAQGKYHHQPLVCHSQIGKPGISSRTYLMKAARGRRSPSINRLDAKHTRLSWGCLGQRLSSTLRFTCLAIASTVGASI